MDQKLKRTRIKKPKIQYFHWKDFDPTAMPKDADPAFVASLTTYRDRLPELLQHAGEYVVIHEEDLRIFPDRDSAITYALKQYWPLRVFTKQIVEKQPIISLGGAAL